MFDLVIKPSSLMVSDNQEEPVEFNWHCEAGLAANIKKVRDEFCETRGLKPIKIFVAGPPLAGKTYFGKKLSEHYNVPHIDLKSLIPEIEKIQDEDHPIKELLTDFKEEHPTEKRYTPEYLYQVVQWRLQENDC
jgi:adenylate kinase